MKKMLLLPVAVMSCMSVFSQEETEIQKWQSAHPTTLLISAERYTGFSDEEKALIGTDYILFNNKITMAQLEQYDQAKTTEKPMVIKDEDQQIIKQWLGTHQGLMIIPQSRFLAFSPERQQYCLERPLEILILEGEVITVKDIENYGH